MIGAPTAVGTVGQIRRRHLGTPRRCAGRSYVRGDGGTDSDARTHRHRVAQLRPRPADRGVAIGLEPQESGDIGARQQSDLGGDGGEDLVGRPALRDQCRDVPQSVLLGVEPGQLIAVLL